MTPLHDQVRACLEKRLGDDSDLTAITDVLNLSTRTLVTGGSRDANSLC